MFSYWVQMATMSAENIELQQRYKITEEHNFLFLYEF